MFRSSELNAAGFVCFIAGLGGAGCSPQAEDHRDLRCYLLPRLHVMFGPYFFAIWLRIVLDAESLIG
jgi:hypothetical protein